MSTPFDFSQLPLSEPTIGALNAPGSPQAVAAILAVTPMASPAGSAFPGNVLIGAAKGLDFVAGAAATPGGEGNQYIEFRDDGSYPQTSTALQVSSDASGRGSAEIRVNKLVFVRNPYTEQFGIGQGQADWMASPTCRLFAANANLKLAVDNSPSGRAGILSFQGTRGMGFSATGSGTIEFNPWPQKYSTPPLIFGTDGKRSDQTLSTSGYADFSWRCWQYIWRHHCSGLPWLSSRRLYASQEARTSTSSAESRDFAA